MNDIPVTQENAAATQSAPAAPAARTNAAPQPKGKEPSKDTGAVTKPSDPGYAEKVAPEQAPARVMSKADRAVEDRLNDNSLPQATLDEMRHGKEILDRRNRPGRRLDTADVEERRQAEQLAGANTELK